MISRTLLIFALLCTLLFGLVMAGDSSKGESALSTSELTGRALGYLGLDPQINRSATSIGVPISLNTRQSTAPPQIGALTEGAEVLPVTISDVTLPVKWLDQRMESLYPASQLTRDFTVLVDANTGDLVAIRSVRSVSRPGQRQMMNLEQSTDYTEASSSVISIEQPEPGRSLMDALKQPTRFKLLLAYEIEAWYVSFDWTASRPRPPTEPPDSTSVWFIALNGLTDQEGNIVSDELTYFVVNVGSDSPIKAVTRRSNPRFKR